MAFFALARCLAAAWLVYRAAATEDKANPMEKVNELLAVLAKGMEREGKEDAATYTAYKKYFDNAMVKSKKIVKQNGDKIGQLESDLSEAEAFREGKSKDLGDLANKLAKDSAELSAGRAGRKKERAVYEKNNAVFEESLDQLSRTLVTMDKKAPAAAAASASLLEVAQRLKNTLMHGSDETLSAFQRETLDSFVRVAQESSSPSFLQTHSRGPYGDYKGKGGGVVSTLQGLQVNVKAEKDDAQKAETQALKLFKDWESGLTTMLENGQKSMSDIKSAIAQSQESSSKKQASLMESKEIFSAEKKHMEGIDTEFKSKTQAYKMRLSKRSDEAIAVHEAQRILGSEIAKGFIKAQKIGSLLSKRTSSLLQLHSKVTLRRNPLQKLRRASSPGLALLALKSSVRRASVRARADPFVKVKSMLKGMLTKLNDKQAQEGSHASYCDQEMGKTAKSKKRKEEDVQKMSDRLDALSAELVQIKADIATGNKDAKDINGAVAAALVIRNKEKKTATAAAKQYKDAAALVTRAVKVLKGYYESKAGGGAEVDKQDFKDRNGMGTGIIGLLEIAVDDFQKLYKETKEAEAASATDFKSLNEESQVRSAVYQKDLEWKTRTKVKLELDEATMNNDLKSYQKELLAIDTYSAKLKASCTVKGPTYAEKKAKREAELKSLKEALTAIAGA